MKFNAIALLVLACGVLSAAIAVYAWRHRATLGARAFAVMMASMTIYVLGYSMELASPNLDAMLFWSRIQYIGILSFPSIYLIFTVRYTGHDTWLTRRNMILQIILPAIFLLAKWLDGSLHLIYASAAVDSSGLIPLLSFTRGPLYIVIVAYNLLVVTLGNFLILRKRRFASRLYRDQTAIMLYPAAILYIVYLIYLSGAPILPSLKQLDLNPFVYLLWGSAISVAIFRTRLFDLTPIAREALIEILSDGVIVLDAQSRVVDANPQALRIFGWKRPPFGELAAACLNNWVDLYSLSRIEKSEKIETSLRIATITVHFEVTISPLVENRTGRIGYLLVIHDISGRKNVEQELRDLSLVDDLTGLTNRRGFKILANQLIGMTRRVKLNAVLFYLDMDRLKWINDTLGHATGDQALKDTAFILKNTFRTSDIIARFGGDEFVILAVESTDNTLEAMLTRMDEQFEIHARKNRAYTLSLSTGTARFEWDQPRSMETLLEEADQAMYVQKQARRKLANPAQPSET